MMSTAGTSHCRYQSLMTTHRHHGRSRRRPPTCPTQGAGITSHSLCGNPPAFLVARAPRPRTRERYQVRECGGALDWAILETGVLYFVTTQLSTYLAPQLNSNSSLGTVTRGILAMQSPTTPSFEKRLTWAEPRAFRKPELRGLWKSVLGIISLTICAAIAFLSITYWFDLGAKGVWTLLVAAGAIIILCLVVWGCVHLMQNKVEITDKAIVVWNLGDVPAVYRFEAVDHCEIGNTSVGSRTISTLVVALKNSDSEVFGVAPSVSTEVLRSTLEQRGVSVVIGTDTMNKQILPGDEGDRCSRIEPSHPDPFESIVDHLKKDGLPDHANSFDELLHHVAWTTGTEMIGELGLEMKRMWPMVKARGSDETKESFRSAARVVRKSWPLFRL